VLDPRADRNDVRRSVHEGALSTFTEQQRLKAASWFPGDGLSQRWFLAAAVAQQEHHEDQIDLLAFQKANEAGKLNLTRAKVAYLRKYMEASSDEEGSPLGFSLEDQEYDRLLKHSVKRAKVEAKELSGVSPLTKVGESVGDLTENRSL